MNIILYSALFFPHIRNLILLSALSLKFANIYENISHCWQWVNFVRYKAFFQRVDSNHFIFQDFFLQLYFEMFILLHCFSFMLWLKDSDVYIVFLMLIFITLSSILLSIFPHFNFVTLIIATICIHTVFLAVSVFSCNLFNVAFIFRCFFSYPFPEQN